MATKKSTFDAKREARLAYHRAYYAANKERLLSQSRARKRSNAEHKRKQDREYYVANKKKIAEYWRSAEGKQVLSRYRQKVAKDPERLSQKRVKDRQYSKDYRERHPEQRKRSAKKYRDSHREQIKSQIAASIAKSPERYFESKRRSAKKYRDAFRSRNGVCCTTARRKSDATFDLVARVRTRILVAINRKRTKKATRTLALIGCNADHLKSHIESLFLQGMSWENRSKWHIDHIVPIASFDICEPLQQRQAFHFTNLQPLWKRDNLVKSSKVLKHGKRQYCRN
jgi:hypothetical protein